LQLILDSLKDPVIVVDVNNRAVTANIAAKGIEQYLETCLLGSAPCIQSYCAFHEIGMEGSCSIKNAIQLNNYSSGFFKLRHSNNGTTYMHSTSTPHDGFIVLHMKHIDHEQGLDADSHEKQIHTIAQRDILTGLPNVFFLRDLVQQEAVRAARQGKLLAVMFIDVSRFKLINSTFGRHQGDIVLNKVAQRIRHALRASDILIRQGGDIFIAAITDLETMQDIVPVAAKIRNAIAFPLRIHDQQISIKTHMGISIYPEDGLSPDSLIKNADIALQSAKSSQHNFFMMYQKEMDKETGQLLLFESRLLAAIERNEFVLYYQPQIETRTGRMLSAEALIRWNSPDFGFIPPAEFIPIAEKIGAIKDIGEWVIQTACKHMSTWIREGFPPITISVNVSIKQFRDPALITIIANALETSCLAPECLCLEITENILMENPETVIATMKTINDMGVKLSMDDFGTGFSSLNYLKRLPVDKLKIDRSFISNITHDEADAAIVRTVINLAHNFKLKVNAEGVETLEQVNFLKKLDCDEIQGYFISKPLPVDDFNALWTHMQMLHAW
jgi:diguanylate cyclase (GGDEF)-like protein